MHDLSIFHSKRIFLTGHTGFKGTWLALILRELGSNVKGYALAPDSGGIFDLVSGDQIVESVVGDVRDADKMNREIKEFSPDFIFHLAAQPLVLQSYINPVDTLTTNINGTINLLEIVRQSGRDIPTLIITTDKVYKNDEQSIAFKETDSLGGKDIYSASKAATELLSHAYASSFFDGRKICTARAGNVIGGGDFSENRIVPDLIRSLKLGNKLKVRNPNHIRPWQHVLESLSGYLLYGKSLLENKKLKASYNFGPNMNESYKVKDLINECQKHVPQNFELEFGQLEGKEASTLVLDSSAARQDLSWAPKWDFQTTIQKTMEWYLSKEDPYQKTKDQIKDYFEF